MTFEMMEKLPDDHPIKRGFVAFVQRRITPTEIVPDATSTQPTAGQAGQVERTGATTSRSGCSGNPTVTE